jgi:hypothetical protein
LFLDIIITYSGFMSCDHSGMLLAEFGIFFKLTKLVYRIILLIYFNLLIFESANDLSIPTKLILECYRKLRFEYQVHASEK